MITLVMEDDDKIRSTHKNQWVATIVFLKATRTANTTYNDYFFHSLVYKSLNLMERYIAAFISQNALTFYSTGDELTITIQAPWFFFMPVNIFANAKNQKQKVNDLIKHSCNFVAGLTRQSMLT